MTEPQDPPRLLDDPGTGELRLGLERMSSNLPSPEALARMAERLGVAPDPTPAGASAIILPLRGSQRVRRAGGPEGPPGPLDVPATPSRACARNPCPERLFRR